MTDPLSVSASIAGLVTLADIVFIRAVKYIKAAKGATDEVKSLCDSLQSLSGALHGLSLFAARLDAESDANDYPTDYRPRLVQSCTQLLGEIRKKLEKHDPSEPGLSRAHSALRQLKWPFASYEVKDILEKIEQHKSALVLALSADTFQALQEVLSAHRSFQDDLAEIKSAIAEQRRTFEAHLSTLYSEKEQRDIYGFFGSESPEDRHRTNMRLRHPETGIWLLDDDDFIAWIDGRLPKLWLTGIPGAGKTVLASVIIEEAWSRVEIGKIAVAYFYCDYKDTNSQDPIKILGSIATQLAQQSVEAFELLQKVYKNCHPVSRMPRSPEASSLVDAIRQMCGFFEDIHLIVDGLDECGDHAREVTSFLRQTDRLTKSGKDMKIALLSRSEEVIRQQLEKEFVHVQISARSEDLRLYVASEMENRIMDGRLDLSSGSMRDEILKALVEGADGMFRWVACQMDYLCEQANEYDMRNALRSLPPSLDSSYRRILERVNTRSAQIQKLVKKTLRWLTYSEDTLSEADLCVAVSISESMTYPDPTRQPTIRAIMTHCSSLVRRSSDTAVLELAHFTVKEFLMAEATRDIPSLAPYILTKEASMLEIAKTFVTYITFPEFDQPLFRDYGKWSTWINQYPFRRVAIGRLVEYAREQWSDAFIFGKMKELFRPPKSKRFLRFAQDTMLQCMRPLNIHESSSREDIMTASLFQGVSELHLAAYLENAPLCKCLIEGGCSVNDVGSLGSPLHWALLRKDAVELGCLREITGDPNAPMVWVNSAILDVLRILVEAGANGRCRFFDTGGSGHSLLSLVRYPIGEESYIDEAVRLLLSAGAQADREFLDIMDAVREEGRTKQVRAILNCFQREHIEDSCKHGFLHLCMLVRSHSPRRWQYFQDFHHFNDEQTPQSSSDVERFHRASRMNDSGTIRDMLEARLVDVNCTTPDHGDTALHVAVQQWSSSSARLLLEYGAEVTRCNVDGESALHKCATIRSESMVSLILDRGANPDDLDVNGCTIYHEVAKEDNVDVLRVLLQHHSFKRSSLEKRNSSGLTPILVAFDKFAEGCIPLLLSVSDDLSCAEETTGWGIVHNSVFLSLESFNSILSKKIDIGLRDKRGRSALHLCCGWDSLVAAEKARVLIERGLDVCSVDNARNTPAHSLLIEPDWPEESVLISLLTLLINTTSFGLEDAEGNTPLLCFLRHPFVKSKTALVLRMILNHVPDAATLGRTRRSSVEVLLESESCFGRLSEDLSQVADIFLELVDPPDGATLLSDEEITSRILAWALWGKQDALVDRLLDHAGDVTTPIPGHNGNSLLEICIDGQASVSLLRRLIDKSPEKAILGIFRGTERTLVHICCENQSETNIKQMEELIAAGTDVDAGCQPYNDTALSLAAKMGKTKHIQILLSHGADAIKTDTGNWSALHFAALGKSPEALKAFRPFDVGNFTPVDLHVNPPHSSEYAFPGCTFTHLVSCNVAVLEDVLSQADPIDLDSRNAKGQTPLHLASITNNVESGRCLLSKGAGIDARDNCGRTSLHFACIYGWLAMVKLLISNGTDVDSQDKDGCSPIHYAAAHGFKDITQELLQCACKHLPDRHGRLPELVALLHKHPDVSKLILERKPSDEETVELRSIPGSHTHVSGVDQVLTSAIARGDKEVVVQLLDSGAIVDHDHMCRCGCSPTLFALQCQQLDILKLLVNRGFALSGHSCAGSPDPGASPAHLALRFAPDNETLETILNQSQTGDLHLAHAIHPVHFAVGIHNKDGLMCLLTHYGCMSKSDALEAHRHPLLDITINVNEVRGPYNISENLSAQMLHGSSPLHLAAHVNNVGAVVTLMDFKANIESRNAQLQTPLHVAALKGSMLALRALLRYGANIYARDGRGRTPIEYSVLAGHLEVLVQLEKHGANIYDSHTAGVNLMTLASQSSSNEALAYLLSRGCAQTRNRFGNLPVEAAWNGKDVTPALLLNSAMLASIDPDHIDGIGALSLIGSHRSSLLKKLWRRMPSDCAARGTIDTKAQPAELSPLCYAAFVGNGEAVDLLVRFGANVNVEGSDDGTPLMTACKAGHLPTVAVLVRHGAAEVYFNGEKTISAFMTAENFPYIQRWLLVDRYTEQAKITDFSGSSDQSKREFWAGFQSLRVPLTSQFGRFINESTIDHLLRLRRLRRSFEGKVMSWPAGAEHPFIVLS